MAFDDAIRPVVSKSQVTPTILASPKFAPSEQFQNLVVPKLAGLGDVAKWLQLDIARLDWLSDARRQHGRSGKPVLQHYSFTFVPKSSGPPRLIEAPKPILKTVQRRILHEILDQLPPHECSHGFVSGRSCMSSASAHAGEAMVVTVDLKDFFSTTRLSRVHNIFRDLGYPWSVARCLTALCSTMTPETAFLRLPQLQRHDLQTLKLFAAPYLPQGAPTSPALANFAAWKLDQGMTKLAQSLGATYTRYADDLAFSGDVHFARQVKSFLAAVESIVVD
jgi:hypothetical protein